MNDSVDNVTQMYGGLQHALVVTAAAITGVQRAWAELGMEIDADFRLDNLNNLASFLVATKPVHGEGLLIDTGALGNLFGDEWLKRSLIRASTPGSS